MSKRPRVLYVADAYCGWCFGFGPRLKEFEAANRDRVDFRVVSGGLFVGERLQPIGRFPHIPEANARIAHLTGVRFGPAYEAVLEQGSFVMDSAAAAAGLAALRSQDEGQGVEFFHQIQQAFYGEGRSLSEPATYARIATARGLDSERVKHMLDAGEAAALARADFAMARTLGVTTYPTLLVADERHIHRLPATGTTLEVMNRELTQELAAMREAAAPTH
jgi:putative protein-disulfide isomerase